MSLIHWWPLNGDTQDKITGIDLTNTGATSTTGKIGYSYYFNGTSGYCLSQSYNQTINPNKFSFAFWIKLASAWSGWGQVLTIGIKGTDWKQIRIGLDINASKIGYFTVSNGTSATSYSGPHYTFGTDIWYHVTGTYDNGEMKLYINGEEVSSFTTNIVPLLSSATIVTIGGNSSEVGECSMNDVRVYDHALSQAEVNELSKALVVHYTFDDILAESTTNLVTQGALSWSKLTVNVSSSHSNGVYTITTTTANNDAASGQIRINFPLAVLTTGETYYFSCKYRVISGTGTFSLSDWCDSSLSDKKTKDCGDFYELSAKCYTTRTYNSTYRFLDCNLSANSVIEVWDVQLQTNDKVTPYVLGTRESMLYNETGLIQPTYNTNTNLIQDSSSGVFSLSCTGNTIINTPIIGDITAGTTISCWIKVPTYPSANAIVFADYNSQLAFGFYGTQNAIISCGGYSAPYVSNIKSNWINGWNHVVVTRNSGGTINCYLNGAKLSTTGSNNWSSTSGYSTIGGRYNGSYTTYFTGYVDDYRVYHTLLSDTDIQDLYRTRAYITDKGDIETHQFIEGKTQAQVTSKYCFECNETQEKPSIPGFELLDGILIEKNPYFDTGLVFSDVNTSIYVDAEVTPTNTSGNNCLAGSGNSSWNGPIMLNFCGGKMEFGTSGYSTSTEPQGQFAANERLTVQAEIYLSTQKWYKNNVQINNITQRTKAATTATFAIGTFKTPSGTVGATNSFKGYIHRFYIKYGDEIRCYLPAKRKSDNVCGLYDIHTKTFLVNSGGGTVSGTTSTLCNEAAIYNSGHISGREIIEI